MLCSFQGTILLLRFLVFFILKNACNIFLKVEPSKLNSSFFLPRKEVIQPHLPIRLPCYDFTPIISSTLDGWSLAVTSPASGVSNSHSVTGGVYKARERIHRAMADARLLANPASRGRVADPGPNWDAFY